MHGRLKVKTTAEQQAEKKKERQKKLKLFRFVLSSAFKKISSEEYDDEGMNITKQILAANPDYTTMWNYRKNAMRYFKENESSEPDADLYWQNELVFLESCLRNNPKSYSCWHQRCFVMQEMPEPDWEKELHLTDLFLQLDDRNFHCWDYRRFVVNNCNHPPSKEIHFTNQLIENNFSNYSSWHYRSKLLPFVYPAANDRSIISEKKLLEELELVQNAFFTDPNDQSAWFYHRWLLGRGEAKQSVLSIVAKKSPFSLICTLRKPVKLDYFDNAAVTVDDVLQDGKWQSLSTAQRYSHAWAFNPLKRQKYSSVHVRCEFGGTVVECNVTPLQDEGVYVAEVTLKSFQEVASDAKLLHLEDELQSCRELNELEPGNKWVLLTLVLLMKAIDSLKYEQIIDERLSELCQIDGKRSSYYSDLQSRYQIENSLGQMELQKRTADFRRKGLTRLCHIEFMSHVTILDISNNKFVRIDQSFSLFHSLQFLKANNNKIKEIDGLKGMKTLKEVDLQSNVISSPNCCAILSTCSSLQFVYLKDNPIKSFSIDDQNKNNIFGVDIPVDD